MRRYRSQLRGLVFLLLVVLLTVVPATGQGTEPTDDEVNVIAKQLYCPVCESIPLDVCGTQACIDWREDIRQKLKEGWTEDEIKQYFVDQHGAQVLSTPPAEGLNLLIYVLPPAAFLVGAFILMRAIRSWRSVPSVRSAEDPRDEQDPYIVQLEEELRKRS